ncbi:hypothetical protein ABXJ76_08795 [Methylobacter sp. G7]|uniref:hypothetical protein n=1 Tax=Methylobacter sp. G7 TaxID=3230117 RepID=UPI003D806BDD
MEDQELETNCIAEDILKRYNAPVADKIIAHTDGSNAYCIVLLTGSPESLSKRFIDALHQAAVRYWDKGRPPLLFKSLIKQDSSH